MKLGAVVAGVITTLVVLGGSAAAAGAGGGGKVFKEIAAPRRAGAAEEVVLRIGETPVPAATLEGFLGRYSTKSVEDFIDRELSVHDVLARGEAKGFGKELERQVRLARLYALGETFFEEGSKEIIRPSADELRSSLPGRMVKGSFDLLLFDSEKEARKALESIRTAGEFADYGSKNPGRLKPVTEISPASGFFHAFDDATLFNREAGEIAGYMETGIGSALVLVKSVRKMSESEIAVELDGVRGELFNNKRRDYFRKVKQRHPLSVDREAIRDFSRKELAREIAPGMDKAFCRVDGISVTYGDFPMLFDTPLAKNLKENELEQLVDLYVKACENVGERIAYGLDAAENDYFSPGASREEWLDERKRRLYYLQGILDFLGEDWTATDKEAKKLYEERRAEKYDVPESVKALYIFVSGEARAKEVRERLAKGENFEKLAEQMSEFDKHGHAKGARVMRIKRGSDIHSAIQDEIFKKRLKPGDVTETIRTPVGYHIFKIVEKAPAVVVPFKKVSGEIKTALNAEKFENGRKKYVKELRKTYKVVKYDAAIGAAESRVRKPNAAAPADPVKKQGGEAGPHGIKSKGGGAH